jgi:hypothetical protein
MEPRQLERQRCGVSLPRLESNIFPKLLVLFLVLAAPVHAARLDLAASAGYGLQDALPAIFGGGELPARPWNQDLGLSADYRFDWGLNLGLGAMVNGPQSYVVLSPHIGFHWTSFALELCPAAIYGSRVLVPVTGLMRIGREDRFHFQMMLRHGVSQATQGRCVLGFGWPVGRRLRMEAGVDPALPDIDDMNWDFYSGGLVLGTSYLVRDGVYVSAHIRNYWGDLNASLGVTWQALGADWLTGEKEAW